MRSSVAALCASVACALSVYPAPSGTAPSPLFSASVNGVAAFVYFTARGLMQPVAPGNNVPAPSNRNTSFIGFGMAPTDAPVTVMITCLASAPTAAAIYPSRAAALLPAPTIAGTTVTIVIDQPRQVCVVVNGATDAPICVFADPAETYVPSPSDPNVVYFGPGTVNAGVVSVAPGQTVYLAPGAHVYGRIQLSSACSRAGAGVAVRGRGVLDGLRFPIDVNGPSLISLNCWGALVEGVTLLNSPKYQLDAAYPYTTVQWVKAIAWGFSTDGFTGGAQSIIRNSFVKVNDDSLKPYATGVLITNIVVWQMENGCAVMGSWNLNQDVSYVTVSQLDIIRHERQGRYYEPSALLCFLHGGSAKLTNYLFADVRVDMPGWAAVQLWVAPNTFASPVGGVLGSLSNIIVRNFSALGSFLAPQPFTLQGYPPSGTVSRVVFDNVTVGGVQVSSSLIAVNTSFAAAPTVCNGCSSSIVGSDWTPAQKCSTAFSYCQSSSLAVSPTHSVVVSLALLVALLLTA